MISKRSTIIRYLVIALSVLTPGCFDTQGEAPEPANEEPSPEASPGRVIAINRTGDAVVRFAVTSDAGCTIVAAGAFDVSEGRVNMATISEADGAMVWYGNVGVAAHGAGYDLREDQFGGAYAQQAMIAPVAPHGTGHYTVAIHNMTWFENRLTGPHSFVVDVDCQGPFEVHDLAGSREMAAIDGWSLMGGIGVQARSEINGAIHVLDAWSTTMQGDHVRVLAVPISAVLTMTWSTPTQEYEWRTGSSEWKVELDGPAGDYSVQVDASVDSRDGTFLAVLADLPPIVDGQVLA